MNVMVTPNSYPIEIDTLQTLLTDFRKKHGDRYDLTALGYFGSYARGEAQPDSDLDIVFQSDKPNLLKTAILKQELEEIMGCSVDLVRWRETMNPSLKVRIEEEAYYV